MKMDGQMRVDENRLKVVSESYSFSTNLNFNYYVLYVIAWLKFGPASIGNEYQHLPGEW